MSIPNDLTNRPCGRRMRSRAFQRGQSSMEYVVVCAALAISLGIGMADDSSVLWTLINAFKTAYQNYSYAISLPT